ncbi:hypothetical protein CXB51_028930 [Gossypium anomalum]|uniref:Disease resistance protein winged helix domain-containing protein n=1 Tax=Gossypium anomalum TaxID=47600 RepID=A0A8J5Y0Q1_9ROSI|nr:hypothetical protein CXB51_028930 [Gossypium anomalum]
MDTQSPYELEALSHNGSLSLLLKWAFNQGDEQRYPNLFQIADETTKKCKSVILADINYETDYFIQSWLANGLLESPMQEDNVCCEDIGLQYFKDLWSKGFVQDVDDRVTYYHFKIYNMIHDLALNKTVSASKNVPRLAFGIRLSDENSADIFEEYFKHMRLIELEICTLKALPKSICTLKHLRHLNLSRCKNLRRVPKSIHKLQSLLTLRLFDLPKFQVPDNLERLINLRFLEITGVDMQLREVCPDNWSSLWVLYFFDCTTLKFLFEGKTKHLGLKLFIIHDVRSLRDLLWLLFEAFASLLEFIQIYHCHAFEELPHWFQNLNSLQRQEILDCPKLSYLPDGVESLTSLTQLKI